MTGPLRPRRLLALPLAAILVAGTAVAPAAIAAASTDASACVRTADPALSVARHWDEAILDGIRRALPAPTVHARNLFHLSAAMYDAWAAWDPTAQGWLVDVAGDLPAGMDVTAAQEEAIGHAAWRILAHRYRFANGGEESLAEFDALAAALCLDPADAEDPARPAALGARIADAYIAFGLTDGANEEIGYQDPSYLPKNRPLIVKRPGARMKAPDRWQPLALDEQVSQNGVPIPEGVQTFIGPHWGGVISFALPVGTPAWRMVEGTPPRLRRGTVTPEYRAAAVAVIRRARELDPQKSPRIDTSPGAIGNNDLGTYNGRGWSVNPVTGMPYAPRMAPLGDWARALAEYWADGPRSETPPGHWNVLANRLADSDGFVHRMGPDAPVLDRLAFDVQLYFTLNGGLHDAAIAAWGAKGRWDSARPISMIRWMASRGQSSRPDLAGYDPDGLPLVDGLIEPITVESSAPGERHAALRRHIGEVAIRTWRGAPKDIETQSAGVGWILATRWTPYAEATFVTPSFAGYVSGHSTFSRAGAEILTRIGGTPFVPGGLMEDVITDLRIEAGPSEPVHIQWASWYDAADLAGISRLYSGFHIPADDLDGRVAGARCGILAWDRAQRYIGGSADPA